MAKKISQIISLFDRYCLCIPAGLTCHLDGQAGDRVAFITDPDETFTVSFEERMELMDMLPEREGGVSVCYQCCKNGKFIHQRRRSDGKNVCIFFHIELKDSDGNTYSLPGQMVVHTDYTWANGVEPLLMELLESVSLQPCDNAGG